MMNYRLIVIDASLKDKSILTKYRILSETKFEVGTPDESPMYKIEIPENDISKVSVFLKNALKYPYYAHLYHEDPNENALIVVFSGYVVTTSKSNPKDAVDYGVQHGVSKEQMNMKPRNIAEEKW